MLTETFWWRSEQQVRYSSHGSGPPLVFCHGTPWSSVVWERVANALSCDFTVYLWDMIGYGSSTKREGQDVSLATQGELLVDLLEHWQLADPQLVAHDYGGAVALRAHLLHGAMYRSLALLDAVALAPWRDGYWLTLLGPDSEEPLCVARIGFLVVFAVPRLRRYAVGTGARAACSAAHALSVSSIGSSGAGWLVSARHAAKMRRGGKSLTVRSAMLG
jgi:pimeloyl-ACP methyl ester carboxylesterase